VPSPYTINNADRSLMRHCRMRYINNMNTATLPPIRVKPAFHKIIEKSLDSGQTIGRSETQEGWIFAGMVKSQLKF